MVRRLLDGTSSTSLTSSLWRAVREGILARPSNPLLGWKAQLFGFSAFRPFGLSAFRPFDLSAFRPFDLSTFRPFDFSPSRPFTPSFIHPSTLSSSRLFDLSPSCSFVLLSIFSPFLISLFLFLMHHPHYSPFDTLNLEPGTYTFQEIDQAYKACVLLVHEDRRNFPRDEWPRLDHVRESKEFLKKYLGSGEVLEHYYWFPRSYWSSTRIRLTTGSFTCCPICFMIYRKKDQALHLDKEHQQYKTSESQAEQFSCNFCRESLQVKSTEDFFQHLHHVHHDPGGVCCQSDLLNELQSHLEEDHDWFTCEPCQIRVASERIQLHLHTLHAVRECDTCSKEQFFEFDHIMREHEFLTCLYCGVAIDRINFWWHITIVEGLEKCQDCPNEEKSALDHLASSHCAQCELCPRNIPPNFKDQHLIHHHKRKRCPHCDRVDPHNECNHRLLDCKYCGQKILEESTDHHLSQIHGFYKCQLCPELVPSSLALRQHFANSHPETEQCPQCEDSMTKERLRSHRIECHGLKACPICDNLFPIEQSSMHIKSYNLHVCAICRQSVLADNYSKHLLEHALCPICRRPMEQNSPHLSCMERDTPLDQVTETYTASTSREEHISPSSDQGPSHPRASQPSRRKTQTQETKRCFLPDCGWTGASEKLRQHKAWHRNKNKDSYKDCEYCSMPYQKNKESRHMEIHHPDLPAASSVSKDHSSGQDRDDNSENFSSSGRWLSSLPF